MRTQSRLRSTTERLSIRRCRARRILIARGTQNPTGGLVCRHLLVRVLDGKSRGLTQNHDGQGLARPGGHDQQIRPGKLAGEGHDAKMTGFPTRRGRNTATVEMVQLWHTLQWGPIEADINDRPQACSQAIDQIGKLACNRASVRPPRSVETLIQFGRQGESDRATQTPLVEVASHERVVVTATIGETT